MHVCFCYVRLSFSVFSQRDWLVRMPRKLPVLCWVRCKTLINLYTHTYTILMSICRWTWISQLPLWFFLPFFHTCIMLSLTKMFHILCKPYNHDFLRHSFCLLFHLPPSLSKISLVSILFTATHLLSKARPTWNRYYTMRVIMHWYVIGIDEQQLYKRSQW